jgi:hypothetical protein
MSDPWQFLILDRNTATERDVKSAYARLLKLHRPDQDPAGFRKLRAAYEAALAEMQSRLASTEPSRHHGLGEAGLSGDGRDASGQNRWLYPWESLPPDVRAELEQLEEALSQNEAEKVAAAVSKLEVSWSCANLALRALPHTLAGAFRDRWRSQGLGIANEVLEFLSGKGQTEFCHVVLSFWEEVKDSKRIADFGSYLLNRHALPGAHDLSELMVRVGMMVALTSPELAAGLARAAFPHLGFEDREPIIDGLEEMIAVGKLFSEMHAEARPFWIQLFEAGAAPDWSSPEARGAVASLAKHHDFEWHGWSLVSQMMPEEVWKPIGKSLNKQAERAQRPFGIPGYVFLLAALFFFALALWKHFFGE